MMPDIPNWIAQADHYRAAFASSLVSIERFNSALMELVARDSSPCTNIHIAVQMAAPFDAFALGSEGVGETAQSQTVPNVDGFSTKVRVSIWKRQDYSGLDLTDVSAAAVNLFKAFWKGQLRSSMSWLISNENSQRANLIDKTLESVLGGTLAAFLYCDLDNFKAANDLLGHVAGDRIIREFGALVESAASPRGIALHRSGDEFLILVPSPTVHKPLQIAKHLHELVRNHNFGTGSIKIDVKIGISVFDGSLVTTYHELERLAESATSIDGKKQGGRARFASVGAARQPPKVDRSSLDTALVLLKSGLGMSQPFANPWLNLISQEVEVAVSSNAHSNEYQDAVTECLEWIRPDFREGILSAAQSDERPVPQHPTFSQMDVALAVAHTAFRAFGSRGTERTLLLRFNKAANFVELRLEPDSRMLFTGGLSQKGEEETFEYDLGAIPQWEGEVPPEDTFKRAVLVRIGHDAVELPSRAFRDIVVVDDRPARGGGLPDFWESAIARLVAACDSSPNVFAVFVWGNERYAGLTWAKIGDIPRWRSQLDSLTFRTGANRASLSKLAERLESAIFRSDSAGQLLPELAGVYRRPIILRPLSQPVSVDDTRFLLRRLDSSGFALSQEDGCRARSIAQAFPLVLEIVRKAASGGRIVDQAGQELNELVDFKVHIDEPLVNMIPAFYREQKESLDKYFEREFVSPTGLFGRYLHNNEEATVVKHVVASLTDQRRSFHTRRAILVIPHTIDSTRELAPLGLVSIRIIPRSTGSRRIINYSFTWRTVEALVGFPYSLYGSALYAQRLTELIRRDLTPTNQATVESGFVSYIAHSLHFFVDRYAQHIARRIVEDASE